jgi:hypothetical protein
MIDKQKLERDFQAAILYFNLSTESAAVAWATAQTESAAACYAAIANSLNAKK